ncbi:YggS family pyridoxal phosphate-dependent enzyme [uncultured Enterococcus sp.]|uniref:YggS family pyridoxal phosphate-dependent enzyme n=1 Tax=uncultured Enterococcus sp. TaxID=167972 RepID=UPI00261B2E44|nr:YggS family pyridoxal phosphate-dependent enzyme [uncultured Enterococcus sp.]
MIENNLAEVNQKIEQACAQVNRNRSEVTLIAVTKTVDIQTTSELIDLGQVHIAENRADKFLAKKAALPSKDIVWHYIGNLQRRKVKEVINEVDYFHALDSLRLADEIQKRANHVIKCFVEVNVSGEESKHGFALEEVRDFILSLQNHEFIQVVGLMTMAPFDSTSQQQHEIFKQLKQKQLEIEALNLSYAPCHDLSMGMSNDYEIAVMEGATYVRVGTALFK